jgi:hypothetical protein
LSPKIFPNFQPSVHRIEEAAFHTGHKRQIKQAYSLPFNDLASSLHHHTFSKKRAVPADKLTLRW